MIVITPETKMHDKFSFATGRTYNGEQVLECEVLEVHVNEDQEYTYTVHVTDASRDMNFRVYLEDLFALGIDKEAILSEYDSGNYNLA